MPYILIVEDLKMRKTITFRCLLAVFLLMMIPTVNAIEYQNQKQLITSKIETMNYASCVKMVKQTLKNESLPILKIIIQIIIKVLRFILEVVGTVFNITKDVVSFLISTVFHIIKAILSLLLFVILTVVFVCIVMEVIVVIIFVVWMLTSSLPLSSYISYELEKLVNLIERTPN